MSQPLTSELIDAAIAEFPSNYLAICRRVRQKTGQSYVNCTRAINVRLRERRLEGKCDTFSASRRLPTVPSVSAQSMPAPSVPTASSDVRVLAESGVSQ